MSSASTKIKTTKPNKYFEKNTFKDVHVIDDGKYFLKGSEKKYIHLCTVRFNQQEFVLFCEAEALVEAANRQRLGDENYEFLTSSKYLQPKLYIERINFLPGRGDSIMTYLSTINEDDLFYFLLEYFRYVGIIKQFEIRGNKVVLNNADKPKEDDVDQRDLRQPVEDAGGVVP